MFCRAKMPSRQRGKNTYHDWIRRVTKSMALTSREPPSLAQRRGLWRNIGSNFRRVPTISFGERKELQPFVADCGVVALNVRSVLCTQRQQCQATGLTFVI